MDLQIMDLHTVDFICVETVYNITLFHNFIVLMNTFNSLQMIILTHRKNSDFLLLEQMIPGW